MTRDEIICMAREAGMGVVKNDLDECVVPVWHLSFDYLARFAALVAAAEREACAKVCDVYAANDPKNFADICAAAIRARSYT